MPRLIAAATALIDNPSEALEQTWRAMYLVDHDELPRLGAQESAGVFQTAAVGRSFEIELEGARSMVLRDAAGQRRLADLSRTEQHHAWCGPQSIEDQRLLAAANHKHR